MSRKLTIALLCWFVLVGQAYCQDVFVPRELKALAVNPPSVKKEAPQPVTKRAEPVAPSVVKERSVKEPSSSAAAANTQTPKTDSPTAKAEKTSVKEKPVDATKTQTAKAEPEKAKTERSVAVKEKAPLVKTESANVAAKKPPMKPEVAVEKAQKPAAPKDEVKVEAVTAKTAKKATSKTEPATAKSEKASVKDDSVSVPTTKTATAKSEKPAKEELPPITVAKTQTVKAEPPAPKKEKVAKESAPAVAATRNQIPKPEVAATKTKAREEAAPAMIAKTPLIKPEPISVPVKEPAVTVPVVSSSMQSAFTKVADGFDFPVGKPEAEGYYKARGYRPHGHMGEDWDGIRGGDTDLKDPIYSIGDGIVVFARDVHLGWGNVIIVRHAYRENGTVKYIDALYGHLHQMQVGRGQRVARGQQIATMGTAHGQYDAHLHFEIRKNLEIGMSKSKFQKDLSNYFVPTDFITAHRHLSGGGANYRVAMNTFTHDWMYHFDSARDFSAHKRSTSESSAALKRALTSTTR
jgi:murein DD-endopeptidase MepM/ murein hydrolase activator NlpD